MGVGSGGSTERSQVCSRDESSLPAAGGLNLTDPEILSLSQGLFVGIHFTPLASSFLYPQTAYLSLSKGEWQIQSGHQGIPCFARVFPNKSGKGLDIWKTLRHDLHI